jgi:2-keto-4-pentenoate hydratase/2-oxohepta-3-ene-1,7-dioic acid hydratase in catechol pathway
MKLVTFRDKGASVQPGLVEGSTVVGLAATGFPDVISIIAGGQAALERARAHASAHAASAVSLDSVKLLAPIPRPPKIICIGLNYRDHAIESNMEIPTVPTVFCKFPTSVVGPGDDVVLPKRSEKPDYEAEFAFVVGRGGRYISQSNWRDQVFGYMNLNDVSARDFQLATTQWIIGKTFDTFCPTGPYLVTADEIADPHALDISLEIDGVTVQNSNTKNLIFNVPFLLEHLSSVMTLEPGDIISTGTPAGVGLGHKPPRWLKPGEEMVVKVQGLGELRNRCVAEK